MPKDPFIREKFTRGGYGSRLRAEGEAEALGPPYIREEDIGKCPKLTMTSHSGGIGCTFRSSLFLVFVFVPSVLVPIIFVLSLVVDITGIAVPVQRPQRLLSIFIDPFFIGLTLWPFLRLYRYARNALIEHPSSAASLRLATIMSTVAMSLPCPLLSLETVGAMMSSGRDAYQGWGIIVIFFLILLPLLGILGWLIGRGIAWMLRP